jgi:hypothetical protein
MRLGEDSQSSISVSTNYGFSLAVPFSKLVKGAFANKQHQQSVVLCLSGSKKRWW